MNVVMRGIRATLVLLGGASAAVHAVAAQDDAAAAIARIEGAQLPAAWRTSIPSFRQGRSAKPVAAMAGLTLVQEGRFSLDQDVNEILSRGAFHKALCWR